MSFTIHHRKPSYWTKFRAMLYPAIVVNSRHLLQTLMSSTNEIKKDWGKEPLTLFRHTISGLSIRRIPSITLSILLLSWILMLSWGEKYAFSNSIAACRWGLWENWHPDAVPHRVVLVADPQLVDPHTYPGRPWPLSRLTVLHTDQYLRRAFTSILDNLQPNTIYFLGDLFDGGREWSTLASKSPEKQWNKYDNNFWLQEYARFGRIFFEPWILHAARSDLYTDRRIISSLPGNHDLGIGNGIQLPVRNRFSVFFGEGNRIDLIGNHTFVAVDTVSLSAKTQPEGNDAAVWQPTQEFLENAGRKKAKTVERKLRARYRQTENTLLEHSVVEASGYSTRGDASTSSFAVSADIPTILLTHVPLYRDPGTPCGPLREKWPPSKSTSQTGSLQSDDANAIRVAAGYQYQNVLQPDISKEILEKVGNVEHVYSGDDHDYCEVIHRGFTSQSGGVREITVKSFSWAMGVRKPGFLMLSLWNPVDKFGRRVYKGEAPGDTATTATVQSHLCVLPNQLTVFVRYGILLFATFLMLAIRALRTAFNPKRASDSSMLLPLSRSLWEGNKIDASRYSDVQLSSSSSNSSDNSSSNAAIRSTAARIRSYSSAGAGNSSASSSFRSKAQLDFMELKESRSLNSEWGQSQTHIRAFSWILAKSVLLFAIVPLLWYIWLARTV